VGRLVECRAPSAPWRHLLQGPPSRTRACARIAACRDASDQRLATDSCRHTRWTPPPRRRAHLPHRPIDSRVCPHPAIAPASTPPAGPAARWRRAAAGPARPRQPRSHAVRRAPPPPRPLRARRQSVTDSVRQGGRIRTRQRGRCWVGRAAARPWLRVGNTTAAWGGGGGLRGSFGADTSRLPLWRAELAAPHTRQGAGGRPCSSRRLGRDRGPPPSHRRGPSAHWWGRRDASSLPSARRAPTKHGELQVGGSHVTGDERGGMARGATSLGLIERTEPRDRGGQRSSRLPAHPIQTRFGWGWMGFWTGTDGRPKPIQAHPNPFWMGSGWGHRNVFGWVFPADGVVPSSALESPDWRGPPEGQRVTLGRSGCSRSPTLDV